MKINYQKGLVSVLICCYNSQKYIKNTLDSVIRQSYKNLEILILDNHSLDHTISIINEYKKKDKRIKLFISPINLGPYGGLNYLLNKASGEYVAIQDHDDIWHKNKLKTQIMFLNKNMNYVGCGTAMIIHYEKHQKFLYRNLPIKYHTAWHTSLVYRNNKKRYNSKLLAVNDFYFMKYILCNKKNLIYNFKKPFLLRIIHSEKTNLSSHWVSWRALLQVMFLSLGILDKAAFIFRTIVPTAIAEKIIINVFYRKNLLDSRLVRKDVFLKELTYPLFKTSS